MNYVAALRRAWKNTKDMPLLLRMYCQGAMFVAPVILFFLVVPLFEWTVDDKPMSYVELWRTGAGLAIGGCLVLVGLGGWGLASRVPRARWAWVAAPLAPFLSLFFFPGASWASALGDGSIIASALLTSAAVYALLFHVPAVRRYLARPASKEKRA